MLGTVINELLADISINSAIDAAEGMTDADGKQHVFPVAKLIHGASKPKPLSELAQVQHTHALRRHVHDTSEV
jgi:hypothetical protein